MWVFPHPRQRSSKSHVIPFLLVIIVEICGWTVQDFKKVVLVGAILRIGRLLSTLISLSEVFVAICLSVISHYHSSKRGRSSHAISRHVTHFTLFPRAAKVTPYLITSHISYYFQGRPKSHHHPSNTRFHISLNITQSYFSYQSFKHIT